MKYYQAHWIEGSCGPRVPQHPFMWAEVIETQGAWALHYTTHDRSPPSELRIMRKPRFTRRGFLIEVEERNKIAMLEFVEFHGRRQYWTAADGFAFVRPIVTSESPGVA